MYSLPTTVVINDNEYKITNKGDYRMVLDCFFALEDEKITKQERLLACLVIFYECFHDMDTLFDTPNLMDFVEPMFNFFNCGDENTGRKVNYKLIDWEKDELLVVSAINKVAQKEIRAEKYVHWWTFMAYYMGIGESTFSTIINLREKKARHKKLEKYEREFINDNPQYFNWDNRLIDQKEADELVREMWNKE